MATFGAENWTEEVKNSQAITLKTYVLEKVFSADMNAATIDWKVDYTPFDATLDQVQMACNLPSCLLVLSFASTL